MFKKLRFFQKVNLPAGEANSSLYIGLFHFLIKQITVPKNVEQLIQLGNKAHQKSKEEIFQTYLLFEKYICSLEPEQKFTRSSLRHRVLEQFSDLQYEDPFFILFLSDPEKKNTIAIQFLFSFLTSVINQFGQAGNGFFERKQADLAELEKQKKNEAIFRELQFLSYELFQFVQQNYGEALAGKMFERHYETLSLKYKELEVFPHLVTLIPKEIVRREHLGIFTQSQIEQVFLEKLAETERLNMALDQKIKEQEATQKLLANNEAMLGSVISSALNAIVMTNSEGMII